MSQVDFLELSFEQITALEQKSIEDLFSMLVEKYKIYGSKKEIHLLEKAYALGKEVHKHQKRETGVLYFTHPLIAALLLTFYKPDSKTLVAMLLHDAVEDGEDSEAIARQITQDFGPEVLHLIDGVSKVAVMIPSEDKAIQTLEKLFAMAEQDVRILIIKLFDRLHNIITILGKKDGKKREKKLKETICIYVPLAERLGLWMVKKRLEDAATLGIAPIDYEKGKSLIEFGKTLHNTISFAFDSLSVAVPHTFTIHEYSVSTVLRKKQNDEYIQPEDSFYVQCEVETIKDIYVLSEEIANIFPRKNALSADFIASPKENGYQALHMVYIVHHSYPILVEFVTSSMKDRNDFGIFIDIYSQNYSLSLLNTTNVEGYVSASNDFLSFLSTEILPQKITIHGKDFGEKTLPSHARVIDALIALYPIEFPYFLSAYINGRPAVLSTHLQQDDILRIVFSEAKTIAPHWKLHTDLLSSAHALDEYFKNQMESIKIQEGSLLLQSSLDEFHKGDVSDFLERFPEVGKAYGITSLDQLLIQIYEGKILVSDLLLLAEKNKNFFLDRFFPRKKSPSSMVARIQFFSAHKDPYECTRDISLLCKKNEVVVHQISVKNTTIALSGEAFLESSSKQSMFRLFDQLKMIPHFSFHLLSSWVFWIKISLLLFFPFFVGFSIFSFLFSSYAQYYTELLSVAVFFIILANISTYWFLRRYFSFARYKKKILTILIIINIVSTGAFLYFFFQKGFDVFHASFFLPLLTLLFSIAMPILVTKKTEKSVLPSITTTEYKEKQRQKKIGYILRTISVTIWGLEPILIKYTPFKDIPPFEKLFFYALGSFLAILLILLFRYIFTRKTEEWNFHIPINKYLFFIFIGFFFMFFFGFYALSYTSGTNFVLLNNFAPTFALLIAFLLWRSQIVYLQKKENAILVFFIFLLGGIGSSFLLYNDFLRNDIGSLWGDVFAIFVMVFDTLMVISQIQYTKYLKGNQGMLVSFFLFAIMLAITTPIVLSSIPHFALSSMLWGLFTGSLVGIAIMLNYETFKRMDGFIAYLMLNIALFITFTIETFVIGTFSLSWLIILGALLILGSSIAAEMLNTHCERKQVAQS